MHVNFLCSGSLSRVCMHLMSPQMCSTCELSSERSRWVPVRDTWGQYHFTFSLYCPVALHFSSNLLRPQILYKMSIYYVWYCKKESAKSHYCRLLMEESLMVSRVWSERENQWCHWVTTWHFLFPHPKKLWLLLIWNFKNYVCAFYLYHFLFNPPLS